ncbi:asparagine synthase (glutamine-hydrolyzing) [Candidatus Micrarchaeota archaeon]|nr:asparagine synthase (glutamine-hydrolyzing) [Candidatus Micrarchaeota archaeon]
MCGIAGFVYLSDKKLLKSMCDCIEHRGPNHFGSYVDSNCSIGYRRLSVIDVKGGNQPLFNEKGNMLIFYNGEVYNYKQLKKELELLGHVFETNTDTETALHGFEQWGVDVLKKLRGMFAFAIWDIKKKRLFLARDKFGKKPIYYTFANGVFAYSSELKSLLLLPGFDKTLDYDSIDKFLALRYIPGPQTIFKNTKKVPPGSYLILENGKSTIKSYWDLEYKPVSHSENYFAKNLLAILDESTRIRLMSEVPLGAYLSGGIDSAAVVSLMAKHSSRAVKTFSVGFGIEKYDELPFARQTSDAFSTDHQELIVSPDSIKELPKIIWHLDEPMADPTVIPTFLLSKFAKKKVTVVLTGEGGDELFGGYEQYKIMQMAYKYAKPIPKLIRKHLIAKAPKYVPKAILDRLFKYSSSLGKKGIERYSEFISDLSSPKKSYLDLVQILSQKERSALYLENGQLKADDASKIPAADVFSRSDDLQSSMQLFGIKTEMADDLLMKVDKMTMAYSIEARAPLLDIRLAEFAFTIPSHLKIKGGIEKYILRKALRGTLPQSVLNRKKARFFVPLDYWFSGDLKSIAENLLLENERKLFKNSEISKIISNYSHSKTYAARQLWSMISLEMWARTYLDASGKKPLSYDEIIG